MFKALFHATDPSIDAKALPPSGVAMEVDYGGKEDETQLWASFKNGDERAFATLYRKYVVALYHYGERLHRDKALIEDSIHDMFVELWKNRNGIAGTSSVKFYLYRCFKNRLLNNLKKKNRFSYAAASDDYQFEMVFSPEAEMIAMHGSQAQKEALLQAVNTLGPRQKEALTLRYYDGLSYEEIALLMALPVKSVYMLIYRSIAFLRKHINVKGLYILLASILLQC